MWYIFVLRRVIDVFYLNYSNKGDYNAGTALHMWAYSSGVDDVVVVLVIDSAAAGGQHVVG